MGRIQIFLKLRIAYLIGRLVSAVKRRVFLYCVIGKVDFPFEVKDVELIGSGTNVALLVPEGLEDAVELADHHVVADVKLPPLVEEGPIDVELHDEGFISTVVVLPLALHDRVQLVHLVDHRDPVAAVGELARLDDPDVSHGATDGKPVILVPLLLADDGLAFLVVAHESLVLRVLGALFDVEGERYYPEEQSSCEFVVLLEVVKEGLLVAEIEIISEVVVHLLLLVLHLP